MVQNSIYLDYNATAPIKPEVIAEVARVMEIGGNPSSVHNRGRIAKAILEKSRQSVARMINCRPQKITFTGGGTEANNIAVKSSGAQHLILSETEHDSIRQSEGHFSGTVEILPVNATGYVTPDNLSKALTAAPAHTLVSIMLANNETGVIQDIKALAEIAHAHGALFHTDAIQAFGKIPLDFRDLGVDMMSLSGHKIGGPQGVGAFVALEKLTITPLIFGGGQEVGRRSGTENLAGIAGFAKAVSLIPQNLQAMDRLADYRNRIEQTLMAHTDQVKFFGQNANRVGNTTTILMPGVLSETQVMAFDLAGICVSSGSACSSGKVKPSHVVSAMGGSHDEALSTIRVSLGWNTTEDDVTAFIEAWKKLFDRKHKG
ncbi:cysteine desulfurase family protein [Paremcibacter congregatus]|uniref:cysteine desulfurase family protein n=1 Tax=Paremcibacter congregatus TaxID=2043170 RepID=UPI0030EC79E2|tara:strand:+ start:2579 stop:3700 length:1122 start_codon:yes stop_codon:yes gene_type:complete